MDLSDLVTVRSLVNARVSQLLMGAVLIVGCAGIREPFGYFVGAVPPRATWVHAVALDESGDELGRLGYDRLARGMHPTVFISTEG